MSKLLRDTRLSAYLARRILEGVQDERLLRQFKQIGLDAASHPVLRGASERQKEAVRRLINVVTLHAALTILDEKNASKRPKDVEPSVARHCSADLGILADAIAHQHSDHDDGIYDFARPPLWGVASNRRAAHALAFSRKTVKADAAIRVFDTGGQGVRWAVVDSGIDATHPAFARWEKLTQAGQFQDQTTPAALSRVVKTLDFTRFAAITSGRIDRALANKLIGAKLPENELKRRVRQLKQSLANGQMLDWGVLEPLLEIAHQPNRPGEHGYERPIDSHGTHVAGIIGANWRVAQYAALREKHKLNVLPPIALEDQNEVCGVCPQIELLDLRVFDPKPGVQTEESATEFAILAALQYVRYLNQSKDRQYVHGVNLSLSLRHEVRSYACGSTPVCLECERLVGSGVIVVAAAGNYGYDDDYGASHLGGAYRGQSITDPGNAPSVLTVGSTHRSDPYQYGISYFSSHGPTGDGRIKPDLVAPGEKIVSTVPRAALAAKDGTSMAAPHVSGVAALLLSRNSELMGHPGRVKEILCKSASDLGRGNVFQGYGLVDALRALQSV